MRIFIKETMPDDEMFVNCSRTKVLESIVVHSDYHTRHNRGKYDELIWQRVLKRADDQRQRELQQQQRDLQQQQLRLQQGQKQRRLQQQQQQKAKAQQQGEAAHVVISDSKPIVTPDSKHVQVPPNNKEKVQEKQQGQPDDSENKLCIICWEAPKTHLFVPCGHYSTCEKCGKAFSNNTCPVCRTHVRFVQRVFIS